MAYRNMQKRIIVLANFNSTIVRETHKNVKFLPLFVQYEQGISFSGTPFTLIPYEWHLKQSPGLTGGLTISYVLLNGFGWVPVDILEGLAGTLGLGGVGTGEDLVGIDVVDGEVLAIPLLRIVDLFKEPNGLPGPLFLFTRVGKLLSDGSNTILALWKKKITFNYYQYL